MKSLDFANYSLRSLRSPLLFRYRGNYHYFEMKEAEPC